VARNLFGGSAADVAEDVNGARVPNATGTAWDGPTSGANQIVDLTDSDGAPISSLAADANGFLPTFYGPDGVERLWVDFGGGKVALTSVTIGERFEAHLVASDPHGTRAYVDANFVSNTAASWVKSPNSVAASAKGVYVPSGWGEFWRPKREAAKQGSGKANVAVFGGSSAVGFYASNLRTKSWPGVLATSLQATCGDGGTGFYSALFSSQGISGSDAAAISQWTTSGGLVTQTGTWSIGGYQMGPGWGYLYASANGATLTFTVRGTTVGIYTLSADGAHSAWSYSIDGATAVAVTDTASTGLVVRKTTVTGLSAGTHTVKLTHTGSAGQYLSVFGVSGENATGTVVNNFGRRNGFASHYTAPGRLDWNGGPQYPCDLAIYMVSPEDVMNGVSADAWASTVRQHLAYIRDGGSLTGATDIVIALPHIGQADFSNCRYQDYVDRAHGLALSFEAALVDLWSIGRNSWNYFNSQSFWANPASPGAAGTDSVHLSDAGNSYVAGVINTLLQS
jgi:lysophospholipase L1-like esterase